MVRDPTCGRRRRYIEKRWEAGDRVTGFSMGLFGHYAPRCSPRIPVGHSVAAIEKVSAGPGRLWIVVQSTRGGLPERMQRWLERTARTS